MNFLGDVVSWFTDSAHWQGTNGIPHRVEEHVVMSVAVVVAALLVALPPSILLGHLRRFGALAVNVSNVGRAIPSFAILVFAAQVVGIGAEPAFIALFVLAVPPLVTNAYVAMAGVPTEVRESARGMGMTGWQSLRRVELPMALPVLLAGVRTAAVQVVATASLAALVAWGGLGRYIIDGLSQRDFVQVFAGAVLVAFLSIVTELALALLQHFVVSAGLTGRHPGKNEPFVGAATAAAE
ncbi:MAG: Glycine betaine transport system permease protein [Acidimicrobiales bacterium]|nr:Glycine betaine transport system permease protein [Acidimicrobiales bacterium]